MNSAIKRILIMVGFSLCAPVILTLAVGARREGKMPRYVFYTNTAGINRTDNATNESKVIFDTHGLYAFSYSASPSDTLVAVLVTERGVTPPGAHEYSIPPRNSLIIIDFNGNVIKRLDEDIQRLAWSPQGDRIAYITGTYYEGGEGFKTTGLHIFGIGDGLGKKIAERAHYLNWPAFDGCIYYNDLRHVYKYNPTTGITQETGYHGVGFSPDGKYYIALTSEDGPYLYVTDNNEEITARIKGRFGYLPQSWIPERDHHMLVVKVIYEPSFLDTVQSVRPRAYVANRKVREKLYYIYDIEKDEIVKEWMEKP